MDDWQVEGEQTVCQQTTHRKRGICSMDVQMSTGATVAEWPNFLFNLSELKTSHWKNAFHFFRQVDSTVYMNHITIVL